MALSQLAFTSGESTAAGFRVVVIYTVPASTRAFIKEINWGLELVAASGTACVGRVYILKTGGTEPTSLTATELLPMNRNFVGIGTIADVSDGVADDETISLSTILEAGDVVKIALASTGSETLRYQILVSGDATAT